MKRIGEFLTALRSLGIFGLIFILMAVILAFGTLSTLVSLFGSFDSNWIYIDVLNELQGTVSFHLTEMELSEYKFVNARIFDQPEGDSLQLVSDQRSAIQETLTGLEEQMVDTVEFGEEELGLLQSIRDGLEQHSQTFNQVVADLDAGDTEQARNLFSESGNETYQVQMDLDYLILLTERARADTLQEFPSDISFAIWVITIGLVVILLLGLWGYTAVSGVTQPLLVLTNAIIAIGGDQYRPELVADLKKRRNRARKLAQALDRLAQTLQNRDAALKQEVDDLRQQLFESRRKRLKISRPNA